MISRRALLAGIVAAPVAAPAIVKAAIELGRVLRLGIAGDAMIRGDLVVNGTLADWSMGDALRDVRALSPSDVLADCAREYERLERLGIRSGPMIAIALDPLANVSDDALDSMYERD